MTESSFDTNIYERSSGIVLGFHGCDEAVAEEVLNSQCKHLRGSINTYDWLGNGIYFWLNDPKRAYEWACRELGYSLNEKFKNEVPDEGGFNLVRPLDCAVIKHAHELVEAKGVYYDTVYGYFQEGADAYDGAGIKEKSHIQICVRNTDCIKGYFLPRII